jgi:phosphate starvation-inducible PhoH-like protein
LTAVDDVAFCELTSTDVVRHKLVGQIVDAYGRYDEKRAAQDPRSDRRNS